MVVQGLSELGEGCFELLSQAISVVAVFSKYLLYICVKGTAFASGGMIVSAHVYLVGQLHGRRRWEEDSRGDGCRSRRGRTGRNTELLRVLLGRSLPKPPTVSTYHHRNYFAPGTVPGLGDSRYFGASQAFEPYCGSGE